MDYAALFGSLVAVHFLALISPGPNVLLVTQTAVSRTRPAGIMTALGIATGALVWSSTAMGGLNFLVDKLAWLYWTLRLIGGGGGLLALPWDRNVAPCRSGVFLRPTSGTSHLLASLSPGDRNKYDQPESSNIFWGYIHGNLSAKSSKLGGDGINWFGILQFPDFPFRTCPLRLDTPRKGSL